MSELPTPVVLETIVTTTGVLAGLLIVVLALVPERRRRKLELLYERRSALQEKKIDVKDEQALKVIDELIQKLDIVNTMLKGPLYIYVGSKKLSLNTYNIMLLSYVVSLFAASLIFMVLVTFYDITIEWLVMLFSAMTILAFALIIPASWWSMIKDYPLGLSK